MKMHYPGNALARYRDQTEAKGSNMNGVMAPSFRCVECGQSRATPMGFARAVFKANGKQLTQEAA